jgi:ABC-type sulfate transport system permease component
MCGFGSTKPLLPGTCVRRRAFGVFLYLLVLLGLDPFLFLVFRFCQGVSPRLPRVCASSRARASLSSGRVFASFSAFSALVFSVLVQVFSTGCPPPGPGRAKHHGKGPGSGGQPVVNTFAVY